MVAGKCMLYVSEGTDQSFDFHEALSWAQGLPVSFEERGCHLFIYLLIEL